MDVNKELVTVEECANLIYNYCQDKALDIASEEQLIKDIIDGYKIEDQKIIDNIANFTNFKHEVVNILSTAKGFSCSFLHNFYDAINLLIDEGKACRTTNRQILFAYTPKSMEILKNINIVKKTQVNDLYDFCKTNDIAFINKDFIRKFEDFESFDDFEIDLLIEMLLMGDKSIAVWEDNSLWIWLSLTENECERTKALKSMTKNISDKVFRICFDNEFKIIDIDKLQNIFYNGKINDNACGYILGYFVSHHLADVTIDDNENKEYIHFSFERFSKK